MIVDKVYNYLAESHGFEAMDKTACKRDIQFAIDLVQGGDRLKIAIGALWLDNTFEAIGFPENSSGTLFGAIYKAYDAEENSELAGNAQLGIDALQGKIDGAESHRESSLLDLVVEWHIELFGDLDKSADRNYADSMKQDCEKHLEFILESGTHDSEAIFIDYCDWVNSVLNGLKVETISLIRFLISIRTCIVFLNEKQYANYLKIVDAGVLHLIHLNSADTTEESTEEGETQYGEYLAFLLKGDRAGATHLINQRVDEGMSIKRVYIDIFQASQYEIGKLWEENKISVAQEHYCTATTQMIMSQLYPQIFSELKNNKRLVATCVGNELHEIGVRMVADFMEMDGWNTYYLGANTPIEAVLSALQENEADLLAISVTMTPHLRHARNLIAEVRASDASGVKIMVGGYPFFSDDQLWKKIGADGFARNAMEVNEVANNLVSS